MFRWTRFIQCIEYVRQVIEGNQLEIIDLQNESIAETVSSKGKPEDFDTKIVSKFIVL